MPHPSSRPSLTIHRGSLLQLTLRTLNRYQSNILGSVVCTKRAPWVNWQEPFDHQAVGPVFDGSVVTDYHRADSYASRLPDQLAAMHSLAIPSTARCIPDQRTSMPEPYWCGSWLPRGWRLEVCVLPATRIITTITWTVGADEEARVAEPRRRGPSYLTRFRVNIWIKSFAGGVTAPP